MRRQTQIPSTHSPSFPYTLLIPLLPDNWSHSANPMTRDEYGVWSCYVPPLADGSCAIPHDSMVKVRSSLPLLSYAQLIPPQVSFTKPDGTTVDRLPPWIKRVTQDLSVSPVYDARFWNPPKSEQYTFKHPRPKPIGGSDSTGGLKIYEAHGEYCRTFAVLLAKPLQSASLPRTPRSEATSSSGTTSCPESPSSDTTVSK